MSDLVPTRGLPAAPLGVGTSALARLDRRTSRAVAGVQRHTLVRLASVQGHELVQQAKVDALSRLTREAMTDHAMLLHTAAAMSHGDVGLADEMRYFTDLAKIGMGEILADTVRDFCEEGRR